MLRIAFDMDGVLLDSGECIRTCLQQTFEEVTGSDSILIDDSFIGPPIRDTATRLLVTPNQALVDRFVERYRTLNSKLSASMTDIYPGIPTVLDSLSRRFEMIVVTSKLETAAITLLRQKSLDAFFAGVHGSMSDQVAETKSETLARAIRTHGEVEALIGDRCHDSKAAQSESVLAVGVMWGFGTREELESCHTNHIVSSPQQLEELLTSLLG